MTTQPRRPRSWDSAKCTANANAYVANKSLIGVIGTFNSGCAKLVIPILNAGAHRHGQPGQHLRRTDAGWPGRAGEPDKYYPSGKRNYARVVAADNFQGPALAVFAQTDLKLKKVFVLNDGQLYGAGLANNFRDAAKKLNLGRRRLPEVGPQVDELRAARQHDQGDRR